MIITIDTVRGTVSTGASLDGENMRVTSMFVSAEINAGMVPTIEITQTFDASVVGEHDAHA